MKFKERISIEVLREKKDIPYASWFIKFIEDETRDFVEERVTKRQIWPHNRPDEKIARKRWVVGEITEVFDLNRWRIGKVTKVLRNERFVVKFFGSIQLKEFHVSSLRNCRVWHENHWSEFVEGKRSSNGCNQHEVSCEKGTIRSHQDKQRTANKSHVCDHKHASKGLVSRRILRKRTPKHDSEECYTMPLTTNQSLFGQIGISYSKSEKETDRTSSYECSVASCSINETAEFNGRGSSHKLCTGSSCHSSDAESSFPAMSCPKRTRLVPGKKLEVCTNMIHNLELQAYKSTVQALFASGPLSWEQETLLTNLRLSLHISNDEHLLQLRHLLSA